MMGLLGVDHQEIGIANGKGDDRPLAIGDILGDSRDANRRRPDGHHIQRGGLRKVEIRAERFQFKIVQAQSLSSKTPPRLWHP